MQSNSVNIGFIIWGVRNGFEVIMASNTEEARFLAADVVTDNMRQVCNAAPRRFYSLHRNNRFAAVTIYHTDVKDMVGRNAYIACTLYVPIAHRFVGNVMNSLNGLMDFYLSKQGSSSVNMFTEDMVRVQFRSLSTEPMVGPVSYGVKKGYLKYQANEDIASRLEQLSIDGYKAVFFLPPSSFQTELQLVGYEQVTEFIRTFRVTLQGYNPHVHSIMQNNQVIGSAAGSVSIDGLPGEFFVVSEKSTGRQRRLQIGNRDESFWINAILPSYDSGGDSRRAPKKRSNLNVIILGSALTIVAILGTMWGIGVFDPAPPPAPKPVENVGEVGNEENSQPPKPDSIQVLSVRKVFKKDTLEKSLREIVINQGKNNIKGIENLAFNSKNDSIIFSLRNTPIDSLGKLIDRLIILVDNAQKPKVPEVKKAGSNKNISNPTSNNPKDNTGKTKKYKKNTDEKK